MMEMEKQKYMTTDMLHGHGPDQFPASRGNQPGNGIDERDGGIGKYNKFGALFIDCQHRFLYLCYY